MWSYLDRSLEARPLDELEEHLDTCTRCCGELEFSRHVRELVATREGAIAMPADVRERIEALIVAEPELDAEAPP
jgi:anti-sigma factor (TIGR02949 family)